MPASRHVRQSRPAGRAGLSILELLGCVVAVAGGVWIGAVYFGVDLNGAAYQALDEADLLEKIPNDWRPENPDCPGGDCPDPAEVRAAQQARLRATLERLRTEAARVSEGIAADDLEPAAAPALGAEDADRRDTTSRYWQELSRIVFEVTAIQNLLEPHLGSEKHGQVLAVRRRVFEYGREAAELLSPEGVDPEAVATGVRVSEWFAHSADQLRTALELKTSQPVGGRSVSAEDLWAQTEAELEKRTDLIRRKSRETSAYLSSRYFVDFPPLGL